MPIYEYGCDLCQCLWEEIQGFNDPVLTVCKGCEKEGGVRKLFSGKIAFHLKGGGWYKDGYAGNSSDPEKGPEESVNEAQEKLMNSSYDPKKEKGLFEDAFEGNVPKEEDGTEITDSYHGDTSNSAEEDQKTIREGIDEMYLDPKTQIQHGIQNEIGARQKEAHDNKQWDKLTEIPKEYYKEQIANDMIPSLGPTTPTRSQAEAEQEIITEKIAQKETLAKPSIIVDK